LPSISGPTNGDGCTRYTPHYEHHLAHLKNEKFTLIEIGIGGYSREKQGGASLRMWKAYFPHAQVIGLDIEDKAFVNEDRIAAYRGSQTDASLLQRLAFGADNLQVVIDDGSHQNEHVITTFGILFPLLPVGGHYVIEDTQTAFWPRVGGSRDLNDPTTSMGFTKTLVDGLNYEEYTDAGYEPAFNELHVVGVHAYHNLVFVDKGINADGRSTMSHD